MKRRALVTGATGYVGSKLCQRLLGDGWTVDALVRDAGRPLPTTLTSTVTPHVYDGSTESVLTAITKSKPDVVFHLASLCIAEHRSEQVTLLIASNVLYGTQLVEACVRKGIKYFINTGTSWQHYRSNAYDPVCLYAATKQAFEDILDFYTDAFPFCATTLKLFDTYGPDDPRAKILNMIGSALRSGEHLEMTPGEQKVDFVHIDDVTEAFCAAARRLMLNKSGFKQERYSVSTGETISIRNLVTLIEEMSNEKLNVTFGARPYRHREVMGPLSSQNWIPGWTPQINLKAGLAVFLQISREQPSYLQDRL